MGRWAKSEKTHTRRSSRAEELLELINNHEPWMSSGTCVSVGPNPWFQDISNAEEEGFTSLAKRICRTRCPVREQCLDYAIRTNQEYGIWGGESRLARTKIAGIPRGSRPQSPMGRVPRSPRRVEPADDE